MPKQDRPMSVTKNLEAIGKGVWAYTQLPGKSRAVTFAKEKTDFVRLVQ